MKILFEQLVSPEQTQLSDLVKAKGGVDALRNNDKILLDLEETASKTSGSPSVEGHRTCQTKSTNADLEVDSLRVDILEDPNAAAKEIGSRSPASLKHRKIRSSTNSRLWFSGRVTGSFES
jgi:hypothetical protein